MSAPRWKPWYTNTIRIVLPTMGSTAQVAYRSPYRTSGGRPAGTSSATGVASARAGPRRTRYMANADTRNVVAVEEEQRCRAEQVDGEPAHGGRQQVPGLCGDLEVCVEPQEPRRRD